MTRFLRRLAGKFRAEEKGTVGTEFVIAIPILLTIFMASFESGMVMVRAILLEHAVDMTMRDLRLGHLPGADSDMLKEAICERTIVFADCQENIMIEMRRVSTSTWSMPSTPITCVDREENVQPVLTLQIGQQNDVMMVRVCIMQNLMFPTTGLGLAMTPDPQGGVGLITESAFVTEPI